MPIHPEEINSYIKWIKEEEKLYVDTNDFLMEMSQSNNFASVLKKALNINPLFAHLVQKECLFIKTHINTLRNQSSRVKFLDKILIATSSIYYKDFVNRQHIITILSEYLNAIRPLEDKIHKVKEENFAAYIRYINSIIKRAVLKPYTNHINKLNPLLFENNIKIFIQSAKNTFQSESLYVQPNLHYYDMPMIASKEILNYLYHKDPQKFEKKSKSKFGLYKQGTKATNLKNLESLRIGVNLEDVYSLVLGKKHEKVGFFLLPEFLSYAHEELHALRYLRGADRSHALQAMPDILKISYNNYMAGLEEYFTIRAGKNNEGLVNQAYGFIKRLSHQGLLLSKSKSDYVNSLLNMSSLKIIALAEAGLIPLSHLEFTIYYNGKRTSTADHAIYLSLSPLVDKLFYGEALENTKKIMMLAQQYMLSPVGHIPNGDTPLHLLVKFSRLWNLNHDKTLFVKKVDDLLQGFLNLGLDIDQENDDCETPLSLAIKFKDAYLVHLLLNNNANKFIFSNSDTIFKVAFEYANEEILNLLINYLQKSQQKEMALKLFTHPDNPMLEAIKHNKLAYTKGMVNLSVDIEFSFESILSIFKTALTFSKKYNDTRILNFLQNHFHQKLPALLQSLLEFSLCKNADYNILPDVIRLGANYKALLQEEGALSKAAANYSPHYLKDFIENCEDIFSECQKDVLLNMVNKTFKDEDFENLFLELKKRLSHAQLAALIVHKNKNGITPLHFASHDFTFYPKKLIILMKHLKKYNLSSHQRISIEWGIFRMLPTDQLKRIDFCGMSFESYETIPPTTLTHIQKNISSQLIKNIQKSSSIRQLYQVYLQLMASKDLLQQKPKVQLYQRFFNFVFPSEFSRVRAVFEYKIHEIQGSYAVHYPRQKTMLKTMLDALAITTLYNRKLSN